MYMPNLHIFPERAVELLWKGQVSRTKFAQFPCPCTILYKSCLFYPSWQATSFERPPSWVAFIERFNCAKYIPISQNICAVLALILQIKNYYLAHKRYPLLWIRLYKIRKSWHDNQRTFRRRYVNLHSTHVKYLMLITSIREIIRETLDRFKYCRSTALNWGRTLRSTQVDPLGSSEDSQYFNQD